MDQASNHPAADGTPGTTATAVSPTALSTWDEYYRAASRRRRAAGGRENFRVQKRRRLLRERLGLGLAALAVGVMMSVFYLVLR